VEREQVVAALEPVLGGLLEEELGLDALAEQAALHVGERGDDGVDRPVLDLGSQLFDGQHSALGGSEGAGLPAPSFQSRYESTTRAEARPSPRRIASRSVRALPRCPARSG